MNQKIFKDYENREIRLTSERWQHILMHPEMAEIESEIATTLLNPEVVRQSNTDKSVHLYYCYKTQTIVGEKWLCVVVKMLENDAFIITAYLTDKLKKGVQLCPKP
jgi:hypothetical protein